ncbi:hypothetical protein LTR05_004050 [Lithohypha guttulata]|uniref:Carrier domain-containing protein n=1 Tax=Lithohypha guttulata TaxID=1690604 RepID=A0AAN7YBJ0_9EURO|nr:hypothetical protein LTR05_004050 [Lithohypha guttulata]
MHERTDSGVAFAGNSDKNQVVPPQSADRSSSGPAEITLFKQKNTTASQQCSSALEGQDHLPNQYESITAISSHVKGPEFLDSIPSVWDNFIESATTYPTSLAISSIHQKGELYDLPNLALDHDGYRADPYVRWSYATLINAVTRLMRALQHIGAKEGFPIVTFLDNVIEFPLILWAAASLGCTTVPLHPRTLLNREEAVHVLTKAISTSSFQETIIFTQNAHLHEKISALDLPYTTRVISLERLDNTSCSPFAEYLLSSEPFDIISLATYRERAQSWTLIVFTSGTTALPKGVVLDCFRLDRWMAKRNNMCPLSPGDSALVNLPTNHAFWHVTVLHHVRSGGAIVLSGSSFSPQHFPDLMDMENCTDIPMPPALVYAIVEVVRARGIRLKSLKRVSLGGAKLSIEFVQNCFDVLGAASVDIMYGQTENFVAATTRGFSNIADFVRGDDISVGWVDLGAELKICSPGDTFALPRNVVGELHYGSVIRCNGYAGEPLPENFYTDNNGQTWFGSGDAALIDDEGLVFIVGRIKDMIIRGGVNISPAAIEFQLAQEPRTKSLNIQVVGKLDPIAGEVPIAISQKAVTPSDVDAIQDTISKYKGPVYLPEEVLTLEQLGLEDFPKTMLGKIQKGKLTTLVREYFERRDSPEVDDQIETDDLTRQVQKIWKRTIGHEVDLNAKLSDFADSITIMRVRDRFARDLGVKLTFADILGNRTVKEQIAMIREQSLETIVPQNISQNVNLTAKNLVHLAGTPELFPTTKAYISDELGKVGLEWDDVQYITPASDFTQVLTHADILNTSWSWKFAFVARAGLDKQAVRKSCELMLTNNPFLPSFLLSNRLAFGSDIALHVVPKSNQKLFNLVFRDYGNIPTKAEFADLVLKPYEYEMALLPGILFHFLLFRIEDTGQTGMIMVSHHAVIDASYMQLIFDDLDKALGGEALPQHISYKTWADSYYSLRTTHEAQVAVNWHVNRLEDLMFQKRSVFPQLPRPHHFLSSQMHIQQVDDNGCHIDFRASGMTNLRRKHPQLSAPVIIKAAWSLMNMHRNDTDCAVFSNLQADRRRFPFVPKALESLSPAHTFEASNVAGLCLQDVVNIIPLHSEENILDFLHRVYRDQEELNQYASAPLKTLLQTIGPVNAEIMLDVLRSQIFNWTPGLGAMQTHNPNENYEPVSSFIRPSLRLVINVDVGGHDDETVFAQIKSPLYDMDGLRSLARDFEDFVLYVCNEANWYERSGNFRSALRQLGKAEPQTNGYQTAHIM